jgi:hypothetical protein
MVRFVRLCFGMLVRLFFGRQSLLRENLALRQQLVMLKRRHPSPEPRAKSGKTRKRTGIILYARDGPVARHTPWFENLTGLFRPSEKKPQEPKFPKTLPEREATAYFVR